MTISARKSDRRPRPDRRGGGDDRERLRAWLEHVVDLAIGWLDDLDAQAEDLEDDELGDDETWDGARG